MSDKSLTVKELFDSDNFSPMDIDLSEIKKLSDALPKDGNIDINNAEVLATKYLRGADLCSELAAIAIAYAQKTDTLKKKAFSEAALVKAIKAGVKTDKSKAWYAEMDEDYIEAANKHSEAAAFVKWINNKYDSFVKMHYLCKKVLDRGYAHEKAASWNGSNVDSEMEDDTW